MNAPTLSPVDDVVVRMSARTAKINALYLIPGIIQVANVVNDIADYIEIALPDVLAVHNGGATQTVVPAVRRDVVDVVADDTVKISVGLYSEVSVGIDVCDVEIGDRCVI